MKRNYMLGIVVLVLLVITATASAFTEIGDNITVVNNVTAQNFLGYLNWAYLLGIPTDFPNSTVASYSGNFPNNTLSGYGNNFPNSTLAGYNNNFPNTSLPNYLLINTYNGDFPNSTLPNYLLISTYSGNFPNNTLSGYGNNFPNTSLPNYLLISTYSGNFPNSTLASKEATWDAKSNFSINVSGQTQIYNAASLIAGDNITLTQSGNTITITSTGGGGAGGVTNATVNPYNVNGSNITTGIIPTARYLDAVNTSALLQSISQVLGLQELENAQNTSISSLQSNDTAHDSKISAIQSNETGYAKLDGSRAVTGSWNWGGFNLTNALRVAASFVEGDGSRLSNLNASNLTGTFNASTDTRTNFPNSTVASKEASWDGKTTLSEVNQSANLYNMNASNITSGQIPSVMRLPAGTVILLSANETDSAAVTSSTTTAETTLMTFNLPANSYTRIIVEAEVEAKENAKLAGASDFRWRFNQSTTNIKTFDWGLININTVGVQEQKSATLKTSFAGGQGVTTTLNLTGQVTANTGFSVTFLAHSFRVYGVI